MSEEHSERSEGIIKVAVLMVGAVLLIGVGFIGGRATAPRGSAGEAAREGGTVARVASATNEATGKAGGGGEAAAGGGEAGAKAPNPGSGRDLNTQPKGTKIGRRADALSERATYDYSDKAGDKVGEHVNEGTSEVAEKVGSSLPGPLKFLAPFIQNSAGYYAGSAVKEGVADKLNDTATEGIKSGKERAGGGEGEGREAARGGEGGSREAAGGGESRVASAGGEGRAQGGAAAATPRWSVELARFATSDNANSYAADMNRQGVGTRVAIQQDPATGQNWYAVRTGAYPGPGAAREALDRLGGEGFHGTVVSEAATGSIR